MEKFKRIYFVEQPLLRAVGGYFPGWHEWSENSSSCPGCGSTNVACSSSEIDRDVASNTKMTCLDCGAFGSADFY